MEDSVLYSVYAGRGSPLYLAGLEVLRMLAHTVQSLRISRSHAIKTHSWDLVDVELPPGVHILRY